MKSFPAIIDSIKLGLTNYLITDDSKYDSEFIGDKVNDVRQTLIKQEYADKKFIDELYYQRTCCLQVFLDKDKSCEVECVPTGINELYVTIPPLISGIGWANIKYFGTLDMQNNFTRKSLSGFMAAEGARWANKKPVITLISSDTILIKNLNCPIEFICMVGLMANPVEACDYNNETDYYPVPDPFKLEMIIKQDILSTTMVPRDERNDSRDGNSDGQQQRKR